MTSKTSGRRSAREGGSKRAWPKRAIALFALILVGTYALVFLTGDREASPKLGIDLRGGTRVTLVPQGEEPTQEQLEQARTILENRVNGMGVSDANVVVDGNTLVITVSGESTADVRNIGQTSQLMFRPVAQPDQQGDSANFPKIMQDMANRWVEYRVITKDEAQAKMKQFADTFNQQVDAMNQAQEQQAQEGQTATKIEPIEAPEVTAEAKPDPENTLQASELRQEATAMLREDRQSDDMTKLQAASWLMQCTPAEAEGPAPVDPLAGTDDPKRPLVACDSATGQPMLLDAVPLLQGIEDPDGPRLTGTEIDTNRPITGGFNSQSGQMEINFAFKQDGDHNGSSTWAALTGAMVGQQVAITLDSQIISAPKIQSPTPVGSATSITGDFTQEEAENLANNLRYGALPLSFAGENGEPGGTATTVPPSLGIASLKAGIIAGLVGLALVAIFVFVYYRLYGLISLFTLLVAGMLVYGALILLGRWIGYTLDLSGVAGLIIGIGTTADSFVVLYERIKDEVRRGRTFRSATLNGWDRAKETIVTGNMVTLIGAVVIYFLAVGEVKGFAFTMGLTTIFDLLVTFLITAPLMILASRSKYWSKPSVNGMGKAFEAGRGKTVTPRGTRRHAAAEAETAPAEQSPALAADSTTVTATPTATREEEK
ncbi:MULTISPECIES: protein translocase subunit SecD [unclassified Corynebacterium]|uniref:protein translocase subunit SecD n=1 Tax=unclassified Corynebacterium TaxID=2624378 RepID=UPI00264ACAFF|nr:MULTISPECIES: protein translocase subunit SecD [unclassified Corynebacterium]MDN8593851.1 protein translocase subunit SecD [Corynebacterium sp. P4_F2]WKK55956.1 protein translocase subunit SecD [Corynebacterium sp. P4-C1]WKK63367.1 protein translocase subunit SecD [Corynebacterium sp. P8-C1]